MEIIGSDKNRIIPKVLLTKLLFFAGDYKYPLHTRNNSKITAQYHNLQQSME